MSISQVKNVDFTKAKSGLLTVGYTLFDHVGNVAATRTTTGVSELMSGSGVYSAYVSFPDNFHGTIVWDSGQVGSDNVFASEQYNVEENNPNVDNIWQIESGRWRIINNQMIFYRDDNLTEIARFDLYDSSGNLTMDSPFERRRA